MTTKVKASNKKKKESETIFLNLNKPFLEKTHIFILHNSTHIYTFIYILYIYSYESLGNFFPDIQT